jgi:4-hydroxy-tetrahydrodipicolinate synthase
MARPKLAEALPGISGILVAPFDANDRFVAEPLTPIIQRAVGAGVHILVSNGNTGEFYSLTMNEAERFVHSAGEAIGNRTPHLAGVGRSVHDAIRLARASKTAGASGLMIHQPPDPFVAPRGVIDYVKRIRDEVDLPLVLYLRNDAIGTAAIAELCAIDGVVGVKWASPNPMRLVEAMDAAPGHIVWVGGLAEVWAPAFYAVGARGFTSGLINIWPERSMAIHSALDQGNFSVARKLIAGMRDFEAVRAEEMNGTNVTGVKSALAMMGEDCGHSRPPSAWPLTPKQATKIKTFLHREGLLKGLDR